LQHFASSFIKGTDAFIARQRSAPNSPVCEEIPSGYPAFWRDARVAGIAVGILAALTLTSLMASMFYGVKSNDPATFSTVALVLTLTALVACFLPALKAAHP